MSGQNATIKDKIQKLSIMFNDKFRFPLFSSLPEDELNNISENVESQDSLRAKAADLCNIIDRVDKKRLDAYIHISTKGSKASLISALKRCFPDQHSSLNEIESNLDMVFLARDFLIHRRNRAKGNLYTFLNIAENSEPRIFWSKLIEKFELILDKILKIFDDNSNLLKQNDIDNSSIGCLKKGFLEKNRLLIEKNRSYLAYMLSFRSFIQDLNLAKEMNVDIKKLREDLLFLYPGIIEITYNDESSTNISIKDDIREELENFMQESNCEE